MVFEADLRLARGADDSAPGGVVTVALCGHWQHEGACRWPHSNSVKTIGDTTSLRTVVIVDDATEAEVLSLMETGLRTDARWDLLACRSGPIRREEHALATALLRTH